MQESNTEQQILAAAEKEFLANGFAGARTTRIAEEAGVNHAMLHYYFRTKELLFEKVLQSKIELLIDSIIDAFSTGEGKTFKERVVYAARRHYDFLKDNEQLPLFVINEVANKPERRTRFVPFVKERITAKMPTFFQDIQAACECASSTNIDPLNLLIEIASLNLSGIIFKPIAQMYRPMTDEVYHRYRCEENMKAIRKLLD